MYELFICRYVYYTKKLKIHNILPRVSTDPNKNAKETKIHILENSHCSFAIAHRRTFSYSSKFISLRRLRIIDRYIKEINMKYLIYKTKLRTFT